MLDFLIPMLFGWPATIASLGLALTGILFNRPKLSLVGSVLFLPPAWYLGLYFSFSFLLPLFFFASVVAVWKNKVALAIVFIAPVFLITGRIAYLIQTQSTR